MRPLVSLVAPQFTISLLVPIKFHRMRRQRATFDEADLPLSKTLEVLDESVPNYNEWLRILVAPAAVGAVVELGAGMGTFSLALLQTADTVVAVEPSEAGSLALCRAAALEPRVIAIRGFAVDAVPYGPFDGAIMSNVLEHIEDDAATLAELYSMLRPGGRLAVFCPAFSVLMSDFDREIGHFRRYRKAKLRTLVEKAGFEIVEARYVNLPGFFAWLLVARVLRLRPTESGLSKWYDHFIVPVTRRIESVLTPPFGQSVLVIARVPLSVPQQSKQDRV